MRVAGFLTFLVVSHFIVIQIFRLTTYHTYFPKAVPLLIAYSALVGFLLYALEMHGFFLYQVVLASGWLFWGARKQSKQIESALTLSDNPEEVRLIAWSFGKTKQYYAYSAFIYVITFSITYLWMLNSDPNLP